jgi:hypothetical protein
MTNKGDYIVMSVYYGIDTLARLCQTGSLEQKCTLSKKILDHDVLTVIYDVRIGIVAYFLQLPNQNLVPQRLENHPYFIVRIIAADFLATVARWSNYFAVQPDVGVTAEMVFRCCRACLVGPDQAKEEMNDPSRRWTTRHLWERQPKVSFLAKSWIAKLIFIHRQMTVREAVKYAARRYAMLQENVFYSVIDLIAPLPVRKKPLVLEILHKRPQILRQLMITASEARPPWYPETEVYNHAAECFASLLNLPMDRVPGVSVSVEEDLQREIDEEWTASLEILRMVTAAPGWINKVYAIWDRVESESWLIVHA